MNPSCTIDTSGLTQGIVAAKKYSRRTVAEICNTSGYWIAVNAKNDMPFVTPQVINSELAVIESPVIGKRGKPLKRKKSYSGGVSSIQRSKDVPLSVLIVAARANPGSRYNQTTNQRYALAKNPFRGVSRAQGQANMKALEDKMIKTRRRSPKFLLAGWIEPIREMAKYAVSKFMRGAGAPLDGARSLYSSRLGDASPAVEGSVVSATIENDVGMEGVNAASFNRALILHGAGALQRAVDGEGTRNMNYALSKAGEELAEVVKPAWG